MLKLYLFLFLQIHDDLITTENQGFIKEVVHDRFGMPTLIKGVPSFKNSVDTSSVVKVDDLPKQEWTVGTRRTGAIARKIGQYPLWKKDGTKIRTTLLQVRPFYWIKYMKKRL